MYRIRIMVLSICIAKTAAAQPHGVSVWLTGQLPVSFSEKWQWTNDFTFRTNGLTIAAYQRFYRTGFRYDVSEKWSAGAGVAFFSTLARSDKDDDEYGKEFRLWQDLTYQDWLSKKLSFQARLRVEERFLEATTLKPGYNILNVNNRVSFARPVSKSWDVQIADEFFEQLIDKHWIYNQNRLQGAGIYNVTKSMQLQGTYIWILRKTFSQHVIQFTIRKMFLTYGRHEHSGE